jgi:hypothetical protein
LIQKIFLSKETKINAYWLPEFKGSQVSWLKECVRIFREAGIDNYALHYELCLKAIETKQEKFVSPVFGTVYV